MERAAGKAVGVHHVGQRRGVVNEIGFVGGEVQHIVQIVGIVHRESAGGVVYGVIQAAAHHGELLAFGIGVPHGGQQIQGAGGEAAVDVAALLGGAGRQGQDHHQGQQHSEKLFHTKNTPLLSFSKAIRAFLKGYWQCIISYSRRKGKPGRKDFIKKVSPTPVLPHTLQILYLTQGAGSGIILPIEYRCEGVIPPRFGVRQFRQNGASAPGLL